MKIALTGTPGTGKTAAGAELAARGYAVECFDELAADCVVGFDRERNCRVVDVDAVDRRFRERHDQVIVEGHLSHLLSVDFAVVLRCHPDVLRGRLTAKGWPEAKIRENVAAEALDVITVQAVGRHGEERVAEVDTTRLSVQQTAEEIVKIAQRGFLSGGAGWVDWSDWVMDHAGQI
ncbi:MAG: adenylate kinase family protein [Candidatus Thermoplasmatota archaeon]|nr:adenylate kinase family protein [Candidatus Thermoplasmatota archaeon]MDD5778320.1 adenylate kinase family protein [Candidatus Thermoplasmatota archaeon]